jgi:CBS-domain-containing membrane protein
MIVSDAMTKKVETISSTTSIRNLCKLIIKKHVNSVLVVDSKKRLKGIVVREDLLSMIFPKYEEFIADFDTAADFDAIEKHIKTIGNRSISEIMVTHIIFVRTHTPLMRALSRMIVHHVDQLPVLSSNDTVVGILTKSDVFRMVFKNPLSGIVHK